MVSTKVEGAPTYLLDLWETDRLSLLGSVVEDRTGCSGEL